MGGCWDDLAERVLAGGELSRAEALAVLQAPDDEVPALLAAAWRVRRHHFGNVVKLNFLINAKSGLCPEDCHYCSQSRVSTAAIARYPLMAQDEILERAERGMQLSASTVCIVTSGRGPAAGELSRVTAAVRALKERHPDVRVCCCLGLLDDAQAQQLAEAGVDRVNHNLNAAEGFYGEICTTHGFADRVATVEAVKAAGISPCSGLIAGLGETGEDLVEVAFALRDLGVDSIPVNFLHPIEGTPLEGRWELDPRRCLRILCMVRLVNPDTEVRISGGREVHLRSLQPLGLYAANALFVADYLTTPGQAPEEDLRMIADLGFVVEPRGRPTAAPGLCGAAGPEEVPQSGQPV